MAFKIIVCAKQVPDTNVIKINPKTGTLIRDGVPSILNHDDANALEEALKISRNDVAEELDGLPPVKMHCSNLAADALKAAIDNYYENSN